MGKRLRKRLGKWHGGEWHGGEWHGGEWHGRPILPLLGLILVAGAFYAGRVTAPARTGLVSEAMGPRTGAFEPWAGAHLVQDQGSDPRELIPLPGTEPEPGPGQQPPPPGAGECPLFFFEDGQFYRLQPDGSGPPGPFGRSPELFPLEPVPPAPAPSRPPSRPPAPAPAPFGAPGVAALPGAGRLTSGTTKGLLVDQVSAGPASAGEPLLPRLSMWSPR
jgi:hypothetical protein